MFFKQHSYLTSNLDDNRVYADNVSAFCLFKFD